MLIIFDFFGDHLIFHLNPEVLNPQKTLWVYTFVVGLHVELFNPFYVRATGCKRTYIHTRHILLCDYWLTKTASIIMLTVCSHYIP